MSDFYVIRSRRGTPQERHVDARRQHILPIAGRTPSFYYFGWYIYGASSHGGLRAGTLAARRPAFRGFLRTDGSLVSQSRTEPNRPHLHTSFVLALMLFSWTRSVDLSGRPHERVRLFALSDTTTTC